MSWPRLTAAAYQDLADAAIFFAAKSHRAGHSFIDEAERTLKQIKRSPRQFGRLETNDSDREIRRALLRRHNYLMIYEIMSDTPEIFAIIHGSQAAAAWKSRLEGK